MVTEQDLETVFDGLAQQLRRRFAHVLLNLHDGSP